MHPYFLPKREPEEALQSVSAIYRRKKTQIEMVRDRGFSIPKEELKFLGPSGLDFFASSSQANGSSALLDKIYIRKKDNHKLSVLYNTADSKYKAKQNKALMQTIEEQYESEEADSFIIITIPQINTSDLMRELKFLVEIFSFDDVVFNPTTNVLSQLHILMTPVERTAFLDCPGLESRVIPGISIENPIVRYYGAKLGDLFYIRRHPGEEVAYYIPELEYWRLVRDIPPVIAAGAKIADDDDDDEGEEGEEGDEGTTADVDE